MEIRNDSRRLGICQRKKSFDESRPLRFNVLEEAKRLEYLNRKIKKSSHRNIIKEIAGYRKSVSPNQRNLNKIDSNLYRYYDELFKVDLNDLKKLIQNAKIQPEPCKTILNEMRKDFLYINWMVAYYSEHFDEYITHHR